MRLLFSYLRAHHVDVSYIGFKRMRLQPAKTLKNDFIEMNNCHTDVSQEDVDVLLGELEKQNPALIGIGLKSSHFPDAKRITAAIKARFNVPVVWGGDHPTIDPENCIRHTDMVCVGEGFDTLLELTQRMAQGKPYEDIQNLWLNQEGRIT